MRFRKELPRSVRIRPRLPPPVHTGGSAGTWHVPFCSGGRQFRTGFHVKVRNDEKFRGKRPVFQQRHYVFALIHGNAQSDGGLIIFGKYLGLHLFFNGYLNDGLDFLETGNDGGRLLGIVFRHGGGEVLLMHAAFISRVFPGFIRREGQDGSQQAAQSLEDDGHGRLCGAAANGGR